MKDFVAIANQYIADVLSGAIVANKWTKAACQRQLDDLARQDSPEWGYFFDVQAATDVCDFLELLQHIKGEKGGQFLSLENWQCFFVTTLFGWKRKNDTRLRRFRRSFLLCGKGNGKSFLSSGIGLYMLAADNEPGAEIICAARETSQARLVFDTAKEMARANPRLCDSFGLTVQEHAIIQKESASVMKPVSAQGKSLAGKMPHAAFCDETWSHRNREVVDEMERGCDKRNNSLLSTITHAGENLACVGYEQHLAATKILSGELKDERTFCLLYSAEGFDWTSADAMRAANPNLGVSVYEDTLIEACERAQKIPALQSALRSHNLCEWVGSTTAWLDPQKVAACRLPGLRMEDFKHWHIGEPGITEPELRPFAIGLDLASRQDLAAVIFLCVGYIDQVEHLYAFGRYYLPEKTIELSPISQYRSWAKKGLITAMPGYSNDYATIQKDILDIQRRHVGYGVVENDEGFRFRAVRVRQLAGRILRAKSFRSRNHNRCIQQDREGIQPRHGLAGQPDIGRAVSLFSRRRSSAVGVYQRGLQA